MSKHTNYNWKNGPVRVKWGGLVVAIEYHPMPVSNATPSHAKKQHAFGHILSPPVGRMAHSCVNVLHLLQDLINRNSPAMDCFRMYLLTMKEGRRRKGRRNAERPKREAALTARSQVSSAGVSPPASRSTAARVVSA